MVDGYATSVFADRDAQKSIPIPEPLRKRVQLQDHDRSVAFAKR